MLIQNFKSSNILNVKHSWLINNLVVIISSGVSTTLIAALSPDVTPGAYYSDCQVETKEKNILCEDLELQKRLWRVSEDIVRQ